MNDQNRWLYRTKMSNDRQTFILTIVGIVLAAMQVITGISEDQPPWQLGIVSTLSIVSLILLVSLWIPKVYFGFWLRSKRKVLRGIYSTTKHSVPIQLIEIERNLNFDLPPTNHEQERRFVDFHYSMRFQKDYRFLKITFTFKNKTGVDLRFESHNIEMTKKGDHLYLDFEFNNIKSVSTDLKELEKTPLIFGTAEMVFNLKTKKLNKIIFNKDQDVVTLAYIHNLED